MKEQTTCECTEMSCRIKCDKDHTHKRFHCEICKPGIPQNNGHICTSRCNMDYDCPLCEHGVHEENVCEECDAHKKQECGHDKSSINKNGCYLCGAPVCCGDCCKESAEHKNHQFIAKYEGCEICKTCKTIENPYIIHAPFSHGYEAGYEEGRQAKGSSWREGYERGLEEGKKLK